MKKTLLILFILMLAGIVSAQNPEFQKYLENTEKQRSEYWKAKQFEKAADLLKSSISFYNSQTKEIKNFYEFANRGNLYNLACALSLNNVKDSALVYLQKSIDAGYSNYLNAKSDTDFENIRKEPKFAELLSILRERGDYEYILKKHGSYNTIETEMPPFTYQSKDAKELVLLRNKYNLDSVAGNGNEISRFINLMKWVHKIVRHDGNSYNPPNRNADAIIEICKKEKRGVNCRMMATILAEIYLSMGYSARFITCMPMGEKFDDCHVINEVYSTTLNKWIWMDPTFEAWVNDEKGNYLSIQETRYRLFNDLPVIAPQSMNWNGKPYGGGPEAYLHNYMTKNLFRFSITLKSCFAAEHIAKSERIYVELYPVGYNPKNVEFGKVINGIYYTTDDKQYWAVPAVK